MKLIRSATLAAALALGFWPALAAAFAPPDPPPGSVVAAAPVSLNATTSSGSSPVALSDTTGVFPFITIGNVGTNEIFCQDGGVAVTVSTSAYHVSVPGGAYRTIWSTNGYVACVTATSTATARITQSNGAAQLGSFGGGSSGGGGGAITGNVGILNTGATQIDPATAQRQDTGNTSLGTIATNTTGAATAANQTTANGSLSTIATNTTGASLATNQTAIQATPGSDATKAVAVQGVTGGKAVKVDGSAVTQPVSNVSLPLPSNAAQETNGNLATIATNTAGVSTATNQTTNTTAINAVQASAGSDASKATAVQGVTGGKAVKVDGSAVTQPISAASNVPVSQATASNLNATVVQTAGTNLHAVLDTTSTTAVTQATASNLNAQVAGDIASGSADSGSGPVKFGGQVATSAPAALTAATRQNALIAARGGLIITPNFGSNVANAMGATGFYDVAGNTKAVGVANTLYNTSTFDPQLEAANATNSTGTGIAVSAGLAQFDDASPLSCTENQFCNVRMSANRNRYETIRDAAGNERGANVDASNNLQVSSNASLAFTPVAPATATATKGQLSGGQYNATPVTATDGQQMAAQYDAKGSQKSISVDSTGAVIDYTQNINVAPGPGGRVDISCSTGNVANATSTCTMPATTGKTTYVTGFDITGSGATVGAAVTCTLTNTNSGTISYTYVITAGALLVNTPLIRSFTPPLKGTAANTAPVLSCPAGGTGNTNMTLNAYGYEL